MKNIANKFFFPLSLAKLTALFKLQKKLVKYEF